MDSNKLIDALRVIRKELIVKDEPLKAYKLLKHFNLEELKTELKNTKGMVRHVYSPKEYLRGYDIPVPDAEMIEEEVYALNAGARYPRYQWILDEIKKEMVTSYLDLGCYVGSMVLTVAKMGIDAYGVDMTKGSIDIANKRAKKFGIENAKFFLGDVTEFTLQKADIVSSMEVLEHVVDPVAYVKNMANLANRWAYVSTPNGPFGNGEGNLTMKGGWEWDGIGIRGHIRVFTKQTLTDVLEEAGCKIALIEARDDQLLHAKFRRPYENE